MTVDNQSVKETKGKWAKCDSTTGVPKTENVVGEYKVIFTCPTVNIRTLLKAIRDYTNNNTLQVYKSKDI